MKVKFWGVRGSIPTPGLKTVRVGGNTACIEIQPDAERLFIMDAGSGIRELGLDIMRRGNIGRVKAHIFLSHTHWDHIHGFPFFVPAFIPGNQLMFYGPVNYNERLEDIVSGQMKYSYFPVKLDHMAAKISFTELKECTFSVEDVRVSAKYLNHPILTLGYRFEYDGKVVVTCYDTEPYTDVFKEEKHDSDMDEFLFGSAAEDEESSEGLKVAEEMNQRIVDFARNADILIYDSQYTAAEFSTKIGWGHSTFDDAINVGVAANCKRVAFFHHEPTRSDDELEAIETEMRVKLEKQGIRHLHAFIATEGMEVDV